MARPVIVQVKGTGSAPAGVWQEPPPGLAVARYEVIGLPLSAAADHVISAAESLATAATALGAPGLSSNRTTALGPTGGPEPKPLRAVAVNVYPVPRDRVVKVHVSGSGEAPAIV